MYLNINKYLFNYHLSYFIYDNILTIINYIFNFAFLIFLIFNLFFLY